VRGTEYATAVGLLVYGARYLARAQAAGTLEPSAGGWWARIWSWFRDFF